MNAYRLPAHLLGLLFLIVAIADFSRGGSRTQPPVLSISGDPFWARFRTGKP